MASNAIIRLITIPQEGPASAMSQDTLLPVLGHCPLCERQLDSEQLLATYTGDDGWPRMLAECPFCVEVVHPL
jgi:hypothetical protein